MSIEKMFKEINYNLDKTDNKACFPMVSILLAVYNPNYIWFKDQLKSLNDQSYKNLKLIIYDDCPEKPLDEKIVEKYINSFDYEIIRGKINLGSNKAFEKLTQIGQGEYFAYCDQDDIWELNKIEILMDKIINEDSVIAYSDMSVIDKNGAITAKSLIEAKPRIRYIEGKNLLHKFFFKNCVSGCCMIVKSHIAKKALPFSEVTIHDQWICMVASACGNISFVNDPLVRYRIHGNNQTGSLKEINNKKDYYNLRINTLKQRLKEVRDLSVNVELGDIEKFCMARIHKKIIQIFKYRYLQTNEAYFEIAIKYMPNWMFKLMLKKLR